MMDATSWNVADSSPGWGVFFLFTYSFQPHYVPTVDSASNRNEYQEFYWG
jgi:hypothetical protein